MMNAIQSAWRDQAIWSEVASQLKASLTKWRTRAAVAGLCGAFLETLAASLSMFDARLAWLRPVLALTGAVVLAAVPYIVTKQTSKERIAEWVRARSTSEALKEVIFRFLLRAPPFDAQSSESDLIQRCEEIKGKARDLNIYAATIEPPSQSRSHALKVDEYVSDRVNDQIDGFYRPKGREKALAANRLHRWEFGLGLLAVVLGAMASAAETVDLPMLAVLGPWVAVVTTAGAAVSAHLAAVRYDHDAIIYFGTAERLTALRDKWSANPNRMDAAAIAKFVDECEHAISSENESWLAGHTKNQEG
jgi:hypothetical protein